MLVYPHFPMKTWKKLALFVAFVGLAVAIALTASRWAHRTPPADVKPTGIGFIDVPLEETLKEPLILLSGWALDPEGVSRVDAVLDGKTRFPLKHGIARADVGAAHPGLPDSVQAGFEGLIDLSAHLSGRHDLRVEVINRRGQHSVIGKRTIVAGQAKKIWPTVEKATPEQTFFVLMATSGLRVGGAAELETLYAPFVSSTMKIGVRVPILYLRTTKGQTKDWQFDPDFDTTRKCGEKILVEDSLNQVIEYAVKHRLPVLFTLNGGIWADAQCDIPEWDVNDALEKEIANCQWNEKNEVFPDDYLKTLPGSMDAPELARALSLNVYASKVRHYKKRNLQQAGRIIRRFASEHPDLFVGINLDPDVYMNPFFESPKLWHDYNPDTLRQFREWLRSSGPYAGPTGGDLPNLSSYRRKNPLALAEIGKLMGKSLDSWDDVDPPRDFPRKLKQFWEDPWVREWELFRRHLVDLHYDELSEWLVEAGIESRFIFSSQGFIAPMGKAMPFAVRLDSPVKNYDSGGMSIEGAVPSQGHLGAILYGDASLNNVRMEGTQSLFATFRSFDANWGVIEHNTADFRAPKSLPGFAAGYRSMRDMFNYGARFVSPMAWNGSNGLGANEAGFAAFTAVRNTPLEDAIREFMLSHANFPRGGKLWTFGAANHADGDGWIPEKGQIRLENGVILLVPDEKTREVVLLSPKELALKLTGKDVAVIAGIDHTQLVDAEIQGLDNKTGRWLPLYKAEKIGAAAMTAGGIALPLQADHALTFEQLRVRLRLSASAVDVRLGHIALHPGGINGR